MDYSTYYAALSKPWFAPPAMVFGIAWSIIYPLIAIAFVLLLKAHFEKKLTDQTLIPLFVLNMIGNALFTPVALFSGSNTLASIVIIFVLGTLGLFVTRVYKQSKIIFWLLVPYVLWGAFATVLQVTITWMNI